MMKIKRGLVFVMMVLFICNIINMKTYAEENSRNIENTSEASFSGERELDETCIPFVDKNGNVTYVDMSTADTEVDEIINERENALQIVNLAYKSGVIKYKEADTGTDGYVVGKSGADAAYLGTDGGNVKFMLSGVVGLVPKAQVQVIRKDSAKSLSYYSVSGGRLYHYITPNLNATKYGGALDNGPAPSYLKSGIKYYSYDGHYFYKDENFEDMLEDYKEGNRNHSVNKRNPFYNYFQYLPLRSQSSYDKNQLNAAINNKVTTTSKMRNIGGIVVEKQRKYGVNALVITGIAANESGWGRSSIAQNKNNLFGLNAVDSSPEDANYFGSVEQCIKEFAEKWMSKEYLNPKNWKYFGGFLGNKASGINVKYASDPYWGEKAAAIAWSLDKENGNKDVNKYTLAIKDMIKPGSVVNVRNQSNTSSTVLYKTPRQANCSYIVLEKMLNNNFYKIQSDGVLNKDRTAVVSGDGIYNFDDMYAYLSVDYATIVIEGNSKPSTSKEGWVTENGKKYYYENGKKVFGEKKINKKWYLFDKTTGAMITGWYNHSNKKVYYSETGEMVYGEKKINKKWYYFNKTTGAMITGWYSHPNKKVYYSETGEMVYGEKKINKKWYYFNKTTGAMITGWHSHPNKKVYYSETGEMVYGEKKINKKWYYFNKTTGAMTTGWCELPGKKVYYQANGQMVYGKQMINGKIYEFDKVTGALKH